MTPSLYAAEAIALALVLSLFGVRAFLRARAASRSVHYLPAGEFPAIEVRERRGGRELWFEAGDRRMLQARIDRHDNLVSRLPYIDGLHLYTRGENAPLRALFIGCGAGIGPRQFIYLHPAAHIDVVDVDGRIFDVATAFYDLRSSARCALHAADGRDFLARCAESSPYDRIVVDVFGANDMPARLCTEEFFRLCRQYLTDQGVCVVNTAGTIEGPSSELVRSIHAGCSAAFGPSSVRVHAVPRRSESRIALRRRRNLLLFGFRSDAPPPLPSSWGERERAILPAIARIAAAPVTFPRACDPLRDASVGAAKLEIR
jgi:spermidine synthase